MNGQQIKQIVSGLNLINKYNNMELDYNYYGIRFEDKEYSIGDIVATSKHNPINDREFPVFGSEAYNNLEDLEGSSCYNLLNKYWSQDANIQDRDWTETKHIYVVAGDKIENRDDLDNGEIVIINAKVVEVIL